MNTTTKPTPTRRQAMALAAAALSAPILLGGNGSAAAAGLRTSVPLPDGIQPEGIASGPGTRFFVGSLNDGRIVTGDLRSGGTTVLLPGAPGRQIRGMAWDPRTNLLWAAGNVGTTGKVFVVNVATGGLRASFTVPGAGFLNDLVITDRHVWVTDSRVDRLTGFALNPNGGLTASTAPTFLPLTGDWPAYDGSTLNANGINVLDDGHLILNNAAGGGLYAVSPDTGASRTIPVVGGPGLTGGDGLERHGQLYYDVRGSGDNEVSVLRLRSTPAGWKALWVGALTGDLDVPATATWAAGSVWALNARFGTPDPATAAYTVTRLPDRP